MPFTGEWKNEVLNAGLRGEKPTLWAKFVGAFSASAATKPSAESAIGSTIEAAGNAWTNGQVLVFQVLSGGAGLVATRPYYIVGRAAGAAVLRAAARNVTAGAKGVAGEALLRSAAALLSSGGKASGGNVIMRGAARVIGQGRKSGIGTALLRGAARLLGGSAPPPVEELPVLFAGGASAPSIAAGGVSEPVVYGSGHSSRVLDAEGGAQ